MNQVDRQLFAVLFAGTMLWIAVPVAMMFIPSDPVKAGFLSKPVGVVVPVVGVAWLLACVLSYYSLRIKGSGARFQAMRVMAFVPAWTLAIVPALVGIALAVVALIFKVDA